MNDRQRWSIERIGHLLAAAGRDEEARAVFEGLTRVSPQSPYAWYGLGILAKRRGEVGVARDYAHHAMKLDSSAVYRLLCAELSLAIGESDVALDALTGVEELPASRARSRALTMRRQWFGH
jgi:hypothetical protein